MIENKYRSCMGSSVNPVELSVQAVVVQRFKFFDIKMWGISRKPPLELWNTPREESRLVAYSPTLRTKIIWNPLARSLLLTIAS